MTELPTFATLQDFWEHSQGRWASQRTSHHLEPGARQTGKGEVTIQTCDLTAPEVQALGVPTLTTAVHVHWQGTLAGRPAPLQGQMLLAFAPDPTQPHQGHLWRRSSGGVDVATGTYVLGPDQALTLVMVDTAGRVTERLWYASPNLRLRTSLMETAAGLQSTVFCSEVRFLTKPS